MKSFLIPLTLLMSASYAQSSDYKDMAIEAVLSNPEVVQNKIKRINDIYTDGRNPEGAIILPLKRADIEAMVMTLDFNSRSHEEGGLEINQQDTFGLVLTCLKGTFRYHGGLSEQKFCFDVNISELLVQTPVDTTPNSEYRTLIHEIKVDIQVHP